ncbi:lactonase family protein [Actinomadura macrotermitis]|uniref:6-phosphogluconolactonase n=1 Tax=Actinomadura macrotermitis TaxID=2585200 RepID=A0A7K0C6G9_9ACTN|nr:lactonase family protein [Actinomadura macrotermitis]MQY09057.1 6-phosphogluconolactonase [Actinomadura macrotermitis]
MSERMLWLGDYTGEQGTGRGVYRIRLRDDGTPEAPELAVEAPDPSYLALHPRGDVLYAVGELTDGLIMAFSVTDGMRLLGSRPVPADPCHLAVSPDGRRLLVASYTAGTVALQRLDAAGAFDGDPAIFAGSGSGPVTDRQEGPHAHHVLWAPDGTVLSTDLGADLIRAFRAEDGGLRPAGETRLPAGYGPRHMALHPSGHLYLVAELAPRVLAFAPGASYAELKPLGEWSRPEGLGAAIKLGADAAHLYVSTRGADTISTYRVVEGGAALEPLGEVPCGGHWPRDLHVAGDRLYVANERSGTVTAFRLDPRPVPLGEPLPAPTPVCLIAG